MGSRQASNDEILDTVLHSCLHSIWAYERLSGIYLEFLPERWPQVIVAQHLAILPVNVELELKLSVLFRHQGARNSEKINEQGAPDIAIFDNFPTNDINHLNCLVEIKSETNQWSTFDSDWQRLNKCMSILPNCRQIMMVYVMAAQSKARFSSAKVRMAHEISVAVDEIISRSIELMIPKEDAVVAGVHIVRRTR